MNITGFFFTMAVGLALLLMGRSLFWVYVALLGFLLGFETTRQYLGGDTQWLPVLAGILVGLAASLLAVFFQYWAVALAGFVGGAYLAVSVLGLLGPGALLPLLVAVIGGVLGALLFVLLFDPALVVVSAVTGAGLLVQPFPLGDGAAALLFLLLAAGGIAFQGIVMSKAEPPGKRNK